MAHDITIEFDGWQLIMSLDRPNGQPDGYLVKVDDAEPREVTLEVFDRILEFAKVGTLSRIEIALVDPEGCGVATNLDAILTALRDPDRRR